MPRIKYYDQDTKSWVPANIVPKLGIDTTLTQSGKAADAKAAGDKINKKLDATKLPEAVNDALAKAKESGEFDGPQGDPGVVISEIEPGDPNKFPVWINPKGEETKYQSLTFTGGSDVIYNGQDPKTVNIPSNLSDLSDDKSHRFVTDIEKKYWNDKTDDSYVQKFCLKFPVYEDVPNYGSPGDMVMSDGAGGIVFVPKEIKSWKEIQGIVRAGLAEELFPVGYEFSIHNSFKNYDMIFVVRGHNNFHSVSNNLSPTMTLEMKNLYSENSGTYIPVQFCNSQALFYSESGLNTGIYNFKVSDQAWFTEDNGKFYKFTLTKPLPPGGQIVLDMRYNETLNQKNVKTYSSYLSTDLIESSVLSEGNEGTYLGETNGKTNGMNHMHRIVFGSNNYEQSAFRQFLNSENDAGNVWNPKTKFDRPPSWNNNLSGLLKGFPKDFLDIVSTVTIPCRTNDVFEVEGLDGKIFNLHKNYNVEDKFFVLSFPEIYGKYDQNDIKDGKIVEYYDGVTNVERIKRDVLGTARYAWLRSPFPWYGHFVRGVYPDGDYSNHGASNTLGVSAACVIA